MSEQPDLVKKLPIIKDLTYLIGSALVTLGVFFGFYYDNANFKKNTQIEFMEIKRVQNVHTDQINKGILEQGIISTELKNTNKKMDEFDRKQDKTIDLLNQILMRQKEK